jgi:hypothetical protein
VAPVSGLGAGCPDPALRRRVKRARRAPAAAIFACPVSYQPGRTPTLTSARTRRRSSDGENELRELSWRICSHAGLELGLIRRSGRAIAQQPPRSERREILMHPHRIRHHVVAKLHRHHPAGCRHDRWSRHRRPHRKGPRIGPAGCCRGEHAADEEQVRIPVVHHPGSHLRQCSRRPSSRHRDCRNPCRRLG